MNAAGRDPSIVAEEDGAGSGPGLAIPERYELQGSLGRGGFGEVYRASDRELGRLVALKVLTPEACRRDVALARFRREVRVQARMRHPHVVSIFDSDLECERPWMAMELVEGEDLRSHLGRHGPMAPAARLRLARELLAAVGALHRAGILHRDLKPANVLLRREDGAAVVMDLGLAQQDEQTVLTETGQLLGTPAYLPPEVVRGEPWGSAADLYQVGAVLFEAVAGCRMVPGDFMNDLLASLSQGVRAELPTGEGAPAPQEERLIRALSAEDPRRRPADAAAALRLLAGEEQLPGIRSAALPALDSRELHRPRLLPAAAGGLLVLLFLAGLLVGGGGGSAADPTRLPAPAAVSLAESSLGAGGLAVEARRPVTVWWEGRPERLRLGEGPATVPIPEGLGDRWVLCWQVEGEVSTGRQALDRDRLLSRMMVRLIEGPGGTDPRPFLRAAVRRSPEEVEGFTEARARMRAFLRWMPELLCGPAYRQDRIRLFEVFQLLQWSAAAERFLGLGGDPLRLPPGTAGSRVVGPWEPGTPAVEPRLVVEDGDYGGAGDTLALTVKQLKEKLPGLSYIKASTGARFRWPEHPREPGVVLRLGFEMARLDTYTMLRLRSEEEGTAPELLVWHPTARIAGSPPFREHLTLHLPADLAPEAGSWVHVDLTGFLLEPVDVNYLRRLRIGWSAPR